MDAAARSGARWYWPAAAGSLVVALVFATVGDGVDAPGATGARAALVAGGHVAVWALLTVAFAAAGFSRSWNRLAGVAATAAGVSYVAFLVALFARPEQAGPAALLATLVLAALAVLQATVAAGAPLGRLVWGGRHRTLPPGLRVASLASIPLYGCFAWVLLARAGVLPGTSGFVDGATWALLAYFVVGFGLNLASPSQAERRTMAPACALLAAATLVVALA